MRHFLSILLVSLFSFIATAQSDSSKFDHQKAIERLKNSEAELFTNILNEYNQYLNQHPKDLSILLERCRFVKNAQYNDYDDYNPNWELADSLSAELNKLYPEDPQVILFRMDDLWGDSLKAVRKHAEKLINKSRNWSPEQKGKLFMSIAENHYYNDEYNLALLYLEKAITEDSSHITSVTYSSVLLELNDSLKAKKAILNHLDTSELSWTLKGKAEILIKLKEYDKALEIFDLIQKRDSNIVDNENMAAIFEGVKKFDLARSYFLKDTSISWNKTEYLLNLFEHDLNYQNSDLAYQSYNAYRDLGFIKDPFGIYRLKLLITYPGAGWKFRDIGGILMLLLLIVVLLIVPSIWVLPVYFIGHYYKVKPKFHLGNVWGLKAMWLVSAGYLLATLFSSMVNPEDLNYYFDESVYYEENDVDLALSDLIFMFTLAFFSFITLFKKNLRVLSTNLIPLARAVLIVLGYFLLYKIGTGIYMRMGISLFDIGADDPAFISEILLNSTQDVIRALLNTYGLLPSLLLVALLVPIYEEIIFRGVFLGAATKHLTYKWANVFQAFLFACVHGELFLFPVFFVFGMVAGNLRLRTGGLLAGILFHIINNFIATLYISYELNREFVTAFPTFIN